MTFVFPFLLGGLVLVGIPVLIHLIMRQKPKTLPFPAFRFLVKRHRTNLRKLRLRHLLLLMLRIGLIVLICLALTRPKIFNEALKIGSDRPVAAVLLFDTSPSMEYTVSNTKGKLTRLEDAKRRGLEMLAQLPDGSRVAILDTADAVQTGKGEWLTSMAQARKRIDERRLRPGSGPVTARLEDAYRLLDQLARAKDDDTGRNLARLLCVFSDRTRACWEGGRLRQLHEVRDQVPLPFDRISVLRGRVPGVVEVLQELRKRLSVSAGQDLPEQALIELLEKARDRGVGLSEDEYPDAEFGKLITAARGKARALLRALEDMTKRVPADAKEYHAKLLGVLRSLLLDLRGAHEVFMDVGVDDPADGGILDLELPSDPRRNAPRQVFAADERVTVRAVVQATGKDFSNTLRWALDNRKEDRPQAVDLKAGEKRAFAFEIDCKQVGPGLHQLQVEFISTDLMPWNNVRYLTFQVREPRKVLVLTDEPEKAKIWKDVHDALREFRVTVRAAAEVTDPNVLQGYQAVYLFDVANPTPALWRLLVEYVGKGGGVGIVPGGKELNKEAYNSTEAQRLLPGKIVGDALAPSHAAGRWDWEKIAYGHPMMAPFRRWKGDLGTDFVANPRSASQYWQVKPGGEGVTPLAYYLTGAPALLERDLGEKGARRGKVLLFTTPLDGREPAWNDYTASLTAFYVTLAGLSTSYLAGDTQPVQLNFLAGQSVPVIGLPLAPRSKTYTVSRPGAPGETVTAEDGQNDLRFPQAVVPGNYVVEGDRAKTGFFSVNVAPEEGVLTRVPVSEVEGLFGAGAVVPLDVRADLRQQLSGHWNQPLELFPFLMVLLLLLLAVENLLANRFYRREPEAQT